MSERLALVIEDDFDASIIFAKALEVIGFNTEVIASGDKALERLKEVEPHMIVLDLHLPEVLGTDILRFIRSQERLASTKVIIASADPRSAEMIQEYADLVLIKPTTFSQVRDFAKRLADAPTKRRMVEGEKLASSKKAGAQVGEKPAEKSSEGAHAAGKKTEPQAASAESMVPASDNTGQKDTTQD